MEINLDKLMDQQIFVLLRDVESLTSTGITAEENLFILKGYEKKQGIWVEVTDIKNSPVTSEGVSLDGGKAIVFIPWHHIVTLAYFPGKSNLSIEQAKSKKIGFRQA